MWQLNHLIEASYYPYYAGIISCLIVKMRKLRLKEVRNMLMATQPVRCK